MHDQLKISLPIIRILGLLMIAIFTVPKIRDYMNDSLKEMSFRHSHISLDDTVANTVYRYKRDCGTFESKNQCAISVEYRISRNTRFNDSEREYAQSLVSKLVLKESN